MKKYSKMFSGVRNGLDGKVLRATIIKWKEKGWDCTRLYKRLDELLREG